MPLGVHLSINGKLENSNYVSHHVQAIHVQATGNYKCSSSAFLASSAPSPPLHILHILYKI